MKSHKYLSTAAAAVIAVLTLVPTITAQGIALRADIPFDFYMNDTLMPAGTYLVSAVQGTRLIQLVGLKGDAAVFAMSAPTRNQMSKASRLVFNRYGDLTFLAQLHWAGQIDGREIPTTNLELEARTRKSPTRVAVVPR